MDHVITAAFTILGASIILLFNSLVVKPLIKLREHIGLTADRIDFYANRITNSFKSHEFSIQAQVRDDLRSAATQLKAKAWAVPMKSVLSFFRLIPEKTNIYNAYSKLIFLSNSLISEDDRRLRDSSSENPFTRNSREIDEINLLLGITQFVREPILKRLIRAYSSGPIFK
jgi:hypothetical protein